MPSGPLSAANDALAWVVFHRDREVFAREFPSLAVKRIEPTMPFVYLASGGFSLRFEPPERTYPATRAVERAIGERGAMFAYLVLERL